MWLVVLLVVVVVVFASSMTDRVVLIVVVAAPLRGCSSRTQLFNKYTRFLHPTHSFGPSSDPKLIPSVQ